MTTNVFTESFTGSGFLRDHVSDSGHTWNTSGSTNLTLVGGNLYGTSLAVSSAIASAVQPSNDATLSFAFQFTSANTNTRYAAFTLKNPSSTAELGVLAQYFSGNVRIQLYPGTASPALVSTLALALDVDHTCDVHLAADGTLTVTVNGTVVHTRTIAVDPTNWNPKVVLNTGNTVGDTRINNATVTTAAVPDTATVSATLPAFTAAADDIPFLRDQFGISDTMTAEIVLNETMVEALALGATMDASSVLEGALLETIGVTPLMVPSGEFTVAMIETLALVDAVLPDGRAVAWVVNLNTIDRFGKKLYPSTMYDGMDFDALGCFNGRYFGSRPDGIYELVGDADGDMPIAAQVLLGKDDFGNGHQKKVQYVYADVAGAAPLDVQVTVDDGAQYTYAMAVTSRLQNGRAVFGRGLRARHWQLLITNRDGADFTLESAEVLAETLKRRL